MRSVALFLLAFTIYQSNGYENFNGDTLTTSLLAFNVLDYHRLDFDRFRDTLAASPEPVVKQEFLLLPSGHLSSEYPIGSAILTFPLYAYFDLERRLSHPSIEPASLSFEPLRRHYEKLAASIVTALCVVLFFLLARLFVAPYAALFATIAYGFGTDVWMINSQNLAQHGPSNLAILAFMYATIRALRAATPRERVVWLVIAGVWTGLAIVVRPTNVLYALPVTAFAVWRFRADAWPFVVAGLAGVAPAIAWDLFFFGRVTGGYPLHQPFIFEPRWFANAFVALLVSPGIGLFVFSPVLLGSFIGLARMRSAVSANEARFLLLMGAGAVAMLCCYAFFHEWWGGYAYGPRYLIEALPVLCLYLAFAFTGWARYALVPLLVVSILIEAVAAYGGAAGSAWTSTPYNVDLQRCCWPVTDTPIERHARAAWYVIVGNPTRRGDYAARFHGDTVNVEATPLSANELEVRALVRNTGSVPWYGYASGVYLGQARVETRIVDSAGHVVTGGNLYVAGNPLPGQTAIALGRFPVPDVRARYTFETNVVTLR